MFQEFAGSYLDGLRACFAELALAKLEHVFDIISSAYGAGRKIFVIGNGGSASTASHMACDMGKGTSSPGRPRLRVISLADNPALLTAWANDVNYESVFKEQLENLLDPGDVVIGISTSGNSPNVLRAIEYANQRGAITIGFIGCGGGKLQSLVDEDVTVSSRNPGQVEDFHLSLNHILAQCLARQISAQTRAEEAVLITAGSRRE